MSKEFQETLSLVHPSLPAKPSIPLSVLTDRTRPRSPEVVVTQRNTPALFGAGLIDAVSDEELLAHQREHSIPARLVGLNGAKDGKTRGHVARLADGRIGRFGWKGEFATLNDFVKAACANEFGLSNPERPQATPLGKPGYKATGVDLTDAQCISMTDFIRGLPTPDGDVPADPTHAKAVAAGRELFTSIGCADCHTPTLGPIAGFYSDLLLHDMGVELESSTGYYGAIIPPPVVRNDRFADQRAADARRVADRAALGGRRLGPVPPRRPRGDAPRGDRAARRRGGRRDRAVQGAARPGPGGRHRLPEDPACPRSSASDENAVAAR